MIDENRRVSIDIHYEISQHYFKEATYLQNWKFREWLSEMVDEEILYWMPIEAVSYTHLTLPTICSV